MDEKVIKIRADVEGFMSELQKASSGVDNLEQKGADGMKSFDNATKQATSSVKTQAQIIAERNAKVQQMLKDEMADLTELKLRRDKAFGVKEIREYDRRIQETGTRIKAMGGTFNELKSVANMNLREMQIELRKLRTAKFDNLSQSEIGAIRDRMATLTDSIGDFKKQINTASADNIPALVNGFHGIISAVQITVGALSLFGVENEKLQKATVQLISVSQGLSQLYTFMEAQTLKRTASAIKDIGLKIQNTYATIAQTLATKAQTMATEGATIATRLFGQALNKIPLFAIIAGVVALVSVLSALAINYYKNNKAIKENSDAYIKQQAILKVNTELNAKAGEVASDRVNSIKVLSERIKAITGDEKKRNQLINEYNKIAESAGGKTLDYANYMKQLNGATEENIELLFKKAKAEAAVELSKELTKEIINNEIKLAKLRKEHSAAVLKQKSAETQITQVSNATLGAEAQITQTLTSTQESLSKVRIADDILKEIEAVKLKNKSLNAEWNELTKIVVASEDVLVIEEKTAKAERKIAIDKIAEAEELARLRAENIKDEQEREMALLRVKHKKERDEIVIKYGKETELLKELKTKQLNEIGSLEQKYKDEQDKLDKERIVREKDEQDKLDKERIVREAESRKLLRADVEKDLKTHQDDLKLMYDEIMNTEGLSNAERLELLKTFLGENTALYKQAMDKIQADKDKMFSSVLDTASVMGGAIKGVFEAMASSSVEGSKKEKQARKNAAIAELAISQAVAIADISKAIVAQQDMPPPLNLIEAIRIGALGAVMVANIVKSSNDIKKMGHGGSGVFEGKSHAQGGIRIGSNLEVEGGEPFWVLSKSMAPKYAPIMQQVFDDIQTGKINQKEQNVFSPNIELNDEYTRKMYETMSSKQSVSSGGKFTEQRQGNRLRRIYN